MMMTMMIGSMHRKTGKDRARGSGESAEICSRTDRQTDRHTHNTHTDVLIIILRHRSRGRRSNEAIIGWRLPYDTLVLCFRMASVVSLTGTHYVKT